MSEPGRLQKAVETTIAAGYQIDKEAFEFLSTISATDDPTAVISKALQKMEELEEKPLFIGKSFLEALLKQPEAKEKGLTQPQPQEELLEQPKEPPQIPEGASVFRPYAKDVKAQINIIEDPTGKLSSNGTMEEFLQYFQDRFKRMEKLLRQRMDVKAATPILEALKSPAKTKMKIIGMVTEKREAKQQMVVTIEDLEANFAVIPGLASKIGMPSQVFTDMLGMCDLCKVSGIDILIARLLAHVGIKSLQQLRALSTDEVFDRLSKFMDNAIVKEHPEMQTDLSKSGVDQIMQNAKDLKIKSFLEAVK